MTDEVLIRMLGVTKRYANGVVGVRNAALTVNRGEVVCIIGPSGSGKSTLLRTINGLETITAGEIHVDGAPVHARNADLNGLRTKVGMVFQQFNLFPHMSVLDNVMLAPRQVLKRPLAEIRDEATQLLAKVGLADKSGAHPAQLSGGQQQRVAIARALAMRPSIMLFDEPTSSLDPEMVGEVLEVMQALAAEGMTMCVVTHEMGFARAVAHRVVFMDGGEIVYQDAPKAFFEAPRNERLKTFLGQVLHH